MQSLRTIEIDSSRAASRGSGEKKKKSHKSNFGKLHASLRTGFEAMPGMLDVDETPGSLTSCNLREIKLHLVYDRMRAFGGKKKQTNLVHHTTGFINYRL